MIDDLAARLRYSLGQQERILRSSLILNPVENIPFGEDIAVLSSPLHGLYNTDKVRTRGERIKTNMQFAGRHALEADSRAIYTAWAAALHAEDVSLRVLSGLHAHIVFFMSMTRPGQTVLLLPERAGGHVSAKAILERLGLVVTEMIVDDIGQRVNMADTLALCEKSPPDYVFVDRSEGLVYEDFSPLAGVAKEHTIFDGSQYLTNIVCGDHPNPLDWGFDYIVASVHKNFPGPQKALLATRVADDDWKRILSGVSVFVSNMHTASTYAAGLTLARREWLSRYSRTMLTTAVRLEEELAELGVPVVRRPKDCMPTHHVWIGERNRVTAFETYERLEQCRIMANFRLLPYDLGYGLRLGVNAAVRLGLNENDTPRLAELIADIRRLGATPTNENEARAFNEMIWDRA